MDETKLCKTSPRYQRMEMIPKNNSRREQNRDPGRGDVLADALDGDAAELRAVGAFPLLHRHHHHAPGTTKKPNHSATPFPPTSPLIDIQNSDWVSQHCWLDPQVHRALDMDKVLVLEAGQVKEFDSPSRLAADR